MLEKVKRALRIMNDFYDEEILDLIEACKIDLQIAGVMVDETNPLIVRAIVVYSRANFGLENPDHDKLNLSYVSLKQHLSLSSEFRANV